MATWLPIRKYNRSQGVRIGSGVNAQKVRAVIRSGDADATSTNVGWLAPSTYINIEDPAIRKQFTYHAAIGAIYVTGPEVHLDAGSTLSPGGRVDVLTPLPNGNDATSIATLSVGPVAVLGTSGNPVYSTGTNPSTIAVPVPGSWTGTNVTSVLVQINTTTGAVTPKVATAAASAPAVPTVDSGNIALASFTVSRTGNTTANTASTVTSLKPY